MDNGTLYTMYRKGEQDVVVALEAATGKTMWEHVYDAPFIVAGRDAEIVKEYHLENGTGPASTPLIVGDVRIPVHREHSFRFNVNARSADAEHRFRSS